MSKNTMHLPEIAEVLSDKGFSVTISNDHRSISVGLNRKVNVSEIEAACDYEIDNAVTVRRTEDGKVRLSE